MWFERAGVSVEIESVLRFTDENQAIQAAAAGQGVALLSLVLAKAEMNAGRLVQPFGPTLPGLGYHIVALPRSTGDGDVCSARDWLLAEAAS